MRLPAVVISAFILAELAATRCVADEPVDELVSAVGSVGGFGENNVEAQRAVQGLSQLGPESLPTILRAYSGANAIAQNWFSGAVQVIADRALKDGVKLPASELEQIVRDDKQNARARRLAFELLLRVDKTATDRLIPGMLGDPSPDFRRDAVARAMDRAHKLLQTNKKDEGRDAYLEVLKYAVDDDQVRLIAGFLGNLGVKVDRQRHIGAVTRWHVIGPFENRKDVGFEAVYPPESEVDLQKSYAGQLGEVKWVPLTGEGNYGVVDIAEKIHDYHGAVMYAFATFDAPAARDVQIRLATPNAWVLWLNDEKLFVRHEYHRGSMFDQYRVPAKLKEGRNTILLKICNNDNEMFVKEYRFQLRVCDSAGVAVHPRTPPLSPSAEENRK
jgi:hypothetical protein